MPNDTRNFTFRVTSTSGTAYPEWNSSPTWHYVSISPPKVYEYFFKKETFYIKKAKNNNTWSVIAIDQDGIPTQIDRSLRSYSKAKESYKRIMTRLQNTDFYICRLTSNWIRSFQPKGIYWEEDFGE